MCIGYIVPNTYKVLDTEIGRASYKSLTSNVLCYSEFHARCDIGQLKSIHFDYPLNVIPRRGAKNRFFLCGVCSIKVYIETNNAIFNINIFR